MVDTTYDLLLEEIKKLRIRLNEVEAENIMHREKISNYEGKLEFYYQFYSDFKNSIRIDNIIPLTNDIKLKPDYDRQLSKHFKNKEMGISETTVVESLFSDYNINPSQILTDIRNTLPDNIDEIVKKYKCEKEYAIIKKSIEHIKNFKRPKKGMSDLINRYIESHIAGKKNGVSNYIKQALILFPFQFNDFLNAINEYRYDKIDEDVEKLKIKLYGKNNMLLTDVEINTNKNKNRKARKVKKPNEKIVKKDIDYSKASVSELIEITKNIKTNKRQKALRVYKAMEKAKRSVYDIMFFGEEVNKFLKTKI